MFEVLEKHPIIPVLVLHDLKDAASIVEALVKGGIEIVEVTLRTPIAIEAIRYLREKFPKLIIAAGTVMTEDQLKKSKEAGANFIVSPGLTKTLSMVAKEINIPYLPGTITPTEVMVAQEMGYRCLKFFPAESVGGMAVLKAFKAVFPDVVFCVTGGINPSNFREYLALENVTSVGGSWFVTLDDVKKKDWNRITMRAKEALESLKKG